MANPTQIMLHVNTELLAAMPITKECSPVYDWDNESRTFSDIQATNENGVPMWETEALLKTGWGANTTPVRLRIAAARKPAVKPDPARLLATLTGEAPAVPSAPAAPSAASTARRAI